MRSVAVLGHSNGLVHVGSRLLRMIGRLGDAAPGDGRTPEARGRGERGCDLHSTGLRLP